MIDCRDTKPFIVQKFDDERLKTDEPILFTHDELNGVFGASFKLPLPSGSTVLVGFFSSNYLENIPFEEKKFMPFFAHVSETGWKLYKETK